MKYWQILFIVMHPRVQPGETLRAASSVCVALLQISQVATAMIGLDHLAMC